MSQSMSSIKIISLQLYINGKAFALAFLPIYLSSNFILMHFLNMINKYDWKLEPVANFFDSLISNIYFHLIVYFQ